MVTTPYLRASLVSIRFSIAHHKGQWHQIHVCDVFHLVCLSMASWLVKLAKISSAVKDYHFHFKSSNFGETLKCIHEPGNKYSCNTRKVLSTKGEMIGQNTCSRNGQRNDTVIGSWIYWITKNVPEWKSVLGRGIEIRCTYKVYGRIDQKSYLYKKN